MSTGVHSDKPAERGRVPRLRSGNLVEGREIHPVWELRRNPQNLRLAIAVNPLMSKAPLMTCALRDGRALVLDLRALQ